VRQRNGLALPLVVLPCLPPGTTSQGKLQRFEVIMSLFRVIVYLALLVVS
jgi:hypothetical protein